MSRKGSVRKRETAPDQLFNSVLISKMVTCVMRQGKKALAEKIVYSSLNNLKNKVEGAEPIKVFEQSIANVRPYVEARPRRIGGATYQIPMEVSEHRAVALAMRWIVGAAEERSGRSMIERLTNELMDAYNNRGGAVTTKENKRKMAEANKAFAHYRW
jgi:small subunit ribosomal protein S7